MNDPRLNNPYQDCNLSCLEVEYIGEQERIGRYGLDMFTDLQTKSSFLRRPFETIEAARDRIRQGFIKNIA